MFKNASDDIFREYHKLIFGGGCLPYWMHSFGIIALMTGFGMFVTGSIYDPYVSSNYLKVNKCSYPSKWFNDNLDDFRSNF